MNVVRQTVRWIAILINALVFSSYGVIILWSFLRGDYELPWEIIPFVASSTALLALLFAGYLGQGDEKSN